MLAAGEAGSPAPAGMVPTSARRPIGGKRFPRTRGDGPPSSSALAITPRVPPHPRGWSPSGVRGAGPHRGSPAPAGMVPAQRSPRTRPGRFPRTRGDGPASCPPGASNRRVPPHPRGWSLVRQPGPHRPPGSPAPAGMVLGRGGGQARYRRFPRTRGDGPSSSRRVSRARSVPPHPRGWSPGLVAQPRGPRGSPAPAGMVPRHPSILIAPVRFPRTRGDGPNDTNAIRTMGMVPPHPRGWSLVSAFEDKVRRGSPAPAGMVPDRHCSAPERARFPRTRGDGPEIADRRCRATKVPPHPRGWSRDVDRRVQVVGGSPAPAGMVPSLVQAGVPP